MTAACTALGVLARSLEGGGEHLCASGAPGRCLGAVGNSDGLAEAGRALSLLRGRPASWGRPRAFSPKRVGKSQSKKADQTDQCSTSPRHPSGGQRGCGPHSALGERRFHLLQQVAQQRRVTALPVDRHGFLPLQKGGAAVRSLERYLKVPPRNCVCRSCFLPPPWVLAL